MTNNAIAQVLTGEGSELFVCDNKAFVSHNRMILEVKDAPIIVKGAIVKFIKADPKRENAYREMAGDNIDDQISQCVKCMFANLDGVPDIDENGNISNVEFVPCDKRGTCKHEGIGCNTLNVSGNQISKAEMRVLELCELEEKEIAERLFLAPATVHRHSQNLRIKTGIPNGKKLALWATSIGVINLDQICF